MGSRIALIVCLLLVAVSLNPIQAANSPFGRSSAEVDSPQAPQQEEFRLSDWIRTTQRDLRSMIAGLVRGFKETKGSLAFLTIIGASFLYGLLHALGPGHGKAIVMSYLIAERRPKLIKGLLAGCIIAFGEAISAVIVVYSIYFFALGRLTRSFQIAERQIQQIAYILILLLGLALLVYRIYHNLPVFRRYSPPDHQAQDRGPGLLAAVLLGLIPCPGVMLLLIFMLTAGLPIWGLAFAFSMACGMAITISGFAVATVVARSHAVTAVLRQSEKRRTIEAAIEILGAVLIIALSLFMLAG